MKVTIEKLDNFGRGIAYWNNKITFVEKALPKEVVDIEIVTEKKKYLEAIIKEIEISSCERIEEECPYSSICGGCQLNHMTYQEENHFKEEKVKSILEKYAHIKNDIYNPICYGNRDHYRNKILLHGDTKELGLYQKRSNEIIPIKRCLLVNETINKIIDILNRNKKNIKECLIKTSNDNSKILVDIKGELLDIKELLKEVNVLILNGEYITKDHSIITNIGNKKYYESNTSFFQINNMVTKELYDAVLEEVKDKSYENVLDLYCGTGSIGIYISDFVKHIIGIDNNPSNIEDANLNKKLNQLNNIEFIEDKVENQIDTFQNMDLIIVDPPRAGLDEKTRKYIQRISPKEIIYVSCDPVTLARDLNELQETYTIKKIKIFNMFPRTYHCESIAVLERM